MNNITPPDIGKNNDNIILAISRSEQSDKKRIIRIIYFHPIEQILNYIVLHKVNCQKMFVQNKINKYHIIIIIIIIHYM